MNKRLSRLTLQNALFIVVLHVLLPAIIAIMYIQLGQRETLLKTFENSFVQVARFVSNSSEEEFRKANHILSLFSQLQEVRYADKTQCTHIAQKIIASNENKSYTNIGAANKEGDTFCSAMPMKNPLNLSEQDGFKHVRESKKFYVGNYRISTITDKAIIVASHPVLDESGNFNGITFAAIDVAYLQNLVKQIALPFDYTIIITDKNGTVLARKPNPEKWVGKNIKATRLGNALFSTTKDGGIFRALGLDGDKMTYAYARMQQPIGGTSIYSVIGIPEDRLSEVSNENLIRNAVFVILILIMSITIAIIDWKFILSKKAEELGGESS